MDQKEWEHWQAVTATSDHKWVEDKIVHLNGRGAMYYTGGEDGIYMRISNDGTLELGTYKGALPHIGKAFFDVKGQKKYSDFNEAFQMVCEIGGKKFLMDMFSTDQIPQDVVEADNGLKNDFIINM